MANELRFDLIVRDLQASRTMDKFGDAADGAGDSLEGMAKDAGQLDKQIAKTKDGLQALIREFDRTGDRTLFKDIRKERREVSFLERLQKDLGGGVGKAGADVGMSFGQSFATAAASAGKLAIPLIAGAAVVLTPAIGAAIGAGVLGGAGGLGILGGIALASRDPRVATAGAAVGEHLLSSFTAVAEPFVDPVIDALGILQTAGDSAANTLSGAFRSLAPLVTPLAHGISGLVAEVMPGFTKALEASKPVLRVLANELPEIGAAISDFLSSISEQGDGAAMILTDLLKFTASAIRATGVLVGALSGMYEWLTRIGAKLSGWAEDIPAALNPLAPLFRLINDDLEDTVVSLGAAKDSSGDFTGSLYKIAGGAGEATAEVQKLSDAISALFGRTLDPIKAAIAYEKAIDDLEEELRDGATTLDLNTQEGRENQQALNDLAEAINGVRESNVKSGMSAAEANAIYERQIDVLRQQAIAAGFSADAINQYADSFKSISTVVETRLIMHNIIGFSKVRSRERQELEGRAHGGPMLPGRDYLVGEHGVELVRQGTNGARVFNNAQTTSMLSGASGGSMPPVINLTITPSGDPLIDVLMQVLRKQIRIEGGNVQSSLGT